MVANLGAPASTGRMVPAKPKALPKENAENSESPVDPKQFPTESG
jgi:hypothetical protein